MCTFALASGTLQAIPAHSSFKVSLASKVITTHEHVAVSNTVQHSVPHMPVVIDVPPAMPAEPVSVPVHLPKHTSVPVNMSQSVPIPDYAQYPIDLSTTVQNSVSSWSMTNLDEWPIDTNESTVSINSTHVPNQKVHFETLALPDTQADVCVVPDTSFLDEILRDGPLPVKTVSGEFTYATAMGTIRVGIKDSHGNHAVVKDVIAYVIPTQKVPSLGVNTRKQGMFFNYNFGVGSCHVHEVSVPMSCGKRDECLVIFNPSFSVSSNTEDSVQSIDLQPPHSDEADHSETHMAYTPTPDEQDLDLDVTSPVSFANQVTTVEYFGGIGSGARNMTGAVPLAYFDNDSALSDMFASTHPKATVYGDLNSLTNKHSDFIEHTYDADVVYVGAPCNDHSVMNTQRHENSDDSRSCIQALHMFRKSHSKVGIFEFVPNFASVNYGRLYSEFCEEAEGYQVFPMMIDSRRYGGVQTRLRLYNILVRNDIASERGHMPLPQESAS
jgi:hypothetical protein